MTSIEIIEEPSNSVVSMPLQFVTKSLPSRRRLMGNPWWKADAPSGNGAGYAHAFASRAIHTEQQCWSGCYPLLTNNTRDNRDCVECSSPPIGGALGRGENARVGHALASTIGQAAERPSSPIINCFHGQGRFTSEHNCETFVTWG